MDTQNITNITESIQPKVVGYQGDIKVGISTQGDAVSKTDGFELKCRNIVENGRLQTPQMKANLEYLFFSEVKNCSKERLILFKKVAAEVDRYVKDHKLNTQQISTYLTITNVTTIMYYHLVHKFETEEIIDVIRSIILVKNPNTVEKKYFTILKQNLDMNLNIITNATLSEYKNSKLFDMHKKLSQLFALLECDKFIDRQDVTIMGINFAKYDKFKTEIFTEVISRDDIISVANSVAGSKSITDFETISEVYKQLDKVGLNSLSRREYLTFIVKEIKKLNENSPIVVIKTLEHLETESLEDDLIPNIELITTCSCGERINISGLNSQIRLFSKQSELYVVKSKLSDVVANVTEVVKTNTELALRSIYVPTENQPYTFTADPFLAEGDLYQYHSTCPKCGQVFIFDLYNNLLLKNYIKQFLETNLSLVIENKRQGYATVSPRQILYLDSINAEHLTITLNFRENKLNRENSLNEEFEPLIPKDTVLELCRKFILKLATKKVSEQLIINRELTEKETATDFIPKLQVNAELNKEMYLKFLHWFVINNCDGNLTTDKIFKIALWWLYGDNLRTFIQEYTEYKNSINQRRVLETILLKYLDSQNLYLQTQSTPEQIITDSDMKNAKNLAIARNKIISSIKQTLYKEAERCLVECGTKPIRENIKKNLKENLTNLATNATNNIIFLNPLTIKGYLEVIMSTIITNDLLERINCATGNVDLTNLTIDDNKCKSITRGETEQSNRQELSEIELINMPENTRASHSCSTVQFEDSVTDVIEKMLLQGLSTTINAVLTAEIYSEIKLPSNLNEISKDKVRISKELNIVQVQDVNAQTAIFAQEGINLMLDRIDDTGDKAKSISLIALTDMYMNSISKQIISEYVTCAKVSLKDYITTDENIHICTKIILNTLVSDYVIDDARISKIKYSDVRREDLINILKEPIVSKEYIPNERCKQMILKGSFEELVTEALRLEILYQIKLYLRNNFITEAIELGGFSIITKIEDNYEYIIQFILRTYQLFWNKNKCFGPLIKSKLDERKMYNFNSGKTNHQCQKELYTTYTGGSFFLKGLREITPAEATPQIWAILKTFDINHYIKYLSTAFPRIERDTAVNIMSEMKSFSDLFENFFKLKVTVLGDKLQNEFHSSEAFKYNNNAEEIVWYRTNVVEERYLPLFEQRFKLKRVLNKYALEDDLVDAIDSGETDNLNLDLNHYFQKFNITGMLTSYIGRNIE